MATTTTFQIGSYNSLNDSFTLTLDLNDRATYYLQSYDLGIPKRQEVRAWNIRTPGEVIERFQYKNSVTTATIMVRAATTTALLAAVRSLVAAIETPPYTLKVTLPGGTAVSYGDVVHTTYSIPSRPKEILAGALNKVVIHFERKPFWRGARQWLANAVNNPGFEAPSGPAVTVFNDTLANFNAYSVQAGGALAQDTYRYPDAVGADLPVVYFRLDEASGAISSAGTQASITANVGGSPTYGVAGALAGDTDTAVTFASTAFFQIATSSWGESTGNAAWSLEGWVKITGNPAAAASPMGYGLTGAKQWATMTINTSGQLVGDVSGTLTTPNGSATLSANVWHHCAITWDGTTLTAYVDGVNAGTATPGALSVQPGSFFIAGTNAHANPFTGSIDEVAVYTTALSAARVTAHYNAGHVAPTTTANTMVIPVGGRVAFGSPVWGAMNTWQVRFRFLTGGSSFFFLHYTDASNGLYVQVGSNTILIAQQVAGTIHQLASASVTLVNGIQYWVQINQFPDPATGSGDPVYVQARLSAGDYNGQPNTPWQATIGAPTFDAVTALSGRPQISASGTALPIGGNFTGVNQMQLFGPGGWTNTSAGTGTASGVWEQTTANTYPNGPTTSYGAGRIDAAPAGTLDAKWRVYTGGLPQANTNNYAIPIQTAGNIVQASAFVKSSGLGNGATIALEITEFNSSGTSLGTTVLQTLTISGGTQIAWPAVGVAANLAGTRTTQAGTAYVDVAVHVVDSVAGNSANATVWIDNVQAWDQTRTGMTSMPYCETYAPFAPAQLMVSGLQGDVPAPATVALGQFFGVWQRGQSATILLGRRKAPTAGLQMVGPPVGWYGSNLAPQATPSLSFVAPGGYVIAVQLSNTNGHTPRFTSPISKDAQGTFHLYAITKCNDVTPASVSLRNRVDLRQQPWYGLIATTNADFIGQTYGSYSYPYNSGNSGVAPAAIWVLVDAGQVILPPYPVGQLNDLTQNYVIPVPFLAGSSATPYTFSTQAGALLPVDGEVFSATAYNPSNATYDVQGQWLYAYWGLSSAGQSGVITYSIESFALPNAAHSGGGTGTANSGAININPVADLLPMVDPTTTLSNSGGQGVNQYTMIAADNYGTVLPVAMEIVYSPLYTYPK